MERTLFTWGEWDECDFLCNQYYDVELIKQVGPFVPGTKFDIAVVDYDNGILQLINSKPDGKIDKFWDFKLALTIS